MGTPDLLAYLGSTMAKSKTNSVQGQSQTDKSFH